MRHVLAFVLSLIVAGPTALRAEGIAATLYKMPGCGCCDGHADHLRANGFDVTVVEAPDLAQIKQRYGIQDEFAGCHTIELGGYVVEGHVPASIIKRLLAERSAVKGIALPGMPDGSPGMGGQKLEPFTIYELTDGPPRVYAVE